MKKFLEYFYILSKLSTSIILFFSLIFLGYLLYISYNSINKTSTNYDERFANIVNLIESNQNEINILISKLEPSIEAVENLRKDFNELNLLQNTPNKKFDVLTNQLKSLEKNIYELEKKIKYNDNNFQQDYNLSEIKQIIFMKVLNNSNISFEIEALHNIVNTDEKNILDKVLIIEKEIYFTYDQIYIQFEEISQNYLKQHIFNRNSNYLTSFLSPILKIQPSNKSSYKNQDLRILKQADEFLLNKKFNDLNKELNKLEFSNDLIDNFKIKIKSYINLQKTLDLIK
tara:strand:+ start:3025 stop:3882 length:858 start_codon:yes stop_codon:yes gene_type:complete